MRKFKFKSDKKNKFNFICNKEELLNSDIINGSHIEMFSNQKIILEGCYGISDYRDDYLKLKLKKGFISLLGNNFYILLFEDEKIIIKGEFLSIEFCV